MLTVDTVTWLNTLAPAARQAWLRWQAARRYELRGHATGLDVYEARGAYFAAAKLGNEVE